MSDGSTPAYRYGRFLFWLCVLALAMYLLPYFLIRAPHFDEWSTSAYGRDLEYAMTASHVDADVVILGDSTALYGLDPKRMSAELGVKVFNISNTLTSLRVTGDLGLKRYLAANKRPRLIVIYLSAWGLDFGNYGTADPVYDGEEMLLRHGTAADVWAFGKQHPAAYLQFPFVFYRVSSPMGFIHPSHDEPAVVAAMGHKPMQPGPSLAGDCALNAARVDPKLPMQSARELYERYNSAAIPVLVYVAPVPTCNGIDVVVTNNFGAIHAAPPRVLAATSIVQDGYYTHPMTAHVGEVSDQLVQAIRQKLSSP